MKTESIEKVIESTPEYNLLTQSTESDIAKPEKYWLFQKGNTAYNLRTKAGVDKLFESPEHFLTEAIKYFEWAKQTPWQKKEQLKTPPKGFKDPDTNEVVFPSQIVDIPTEKPYTIEGLCLYLGITLQTFLNYEKKEGYNAFFDVLSYVRSIIENQQLEGGLVGAFNPAIIIRKLGLKDQVDSKIDVNNTVTSITFVRQAVEDADYTEVNQMLDEG